MKRIHRRWHRLIWALLLPGVALLLLSADRVRGDPVAGAVLPTALINAPVEGSR